jgi:FkbM family methyltransferase
MYYGQRETDRYIEDYFKDQKDGNCIEVGVSDGIKGSNTLLFEKRGWKTLCIDPVPEHVEQAKRIREQVIECACSHYNGFDYFTSYNIGENNIRSSLSSLATDPRLIESHKDIINDTDQFMVTVKRLTNVLDDVNWPKEIDFVSVDTEGTELDVLKGMDFNKYRVKLLVVENNFEDADVKDYLNDLGFIFDQRFFVNDFYVNKEYNDKCNGE